MIMKKKCKHCYFRSLRNYKGIDMCVIRFFGETDPEKCSGYKRIWWHFWAEK